MTQQNRRAPLSWRKRLKARYGHLYQAMSAKGDPCHYCALPAGTVDHVPPLSALGEFGADYFRAMGIQPATVACCHECNATRGGRSLWWIEDRKAYLLERYKRVYFEILDMPYWSQEEINELTGQLQKYVSEMAKLRGILLFRLKRLGADRYASHAASASRVSEWIAGWGSR